MIFTTHGFSHLVSFIGPHLIKETAWSQPPQITKTALMIARLERSDQALRNAVAHLHGYIETELRNQKRK
jgi:hypothetical protein